MTAQLPAPEWCKPGAPAYMHTGHDAYYRAEIVKVTATQVVAKTAAGEYRFSLKHELREIGAGSVYRRAYLVAPNDPAMIQKAASRAARAARQEAAKTAWSRVDEWVRTGDPEALEASIRTLTEKRTA